MRTTPDLIAELEDEARKHWYVTMVIGFETSTIFVRATDDNRIAMLNSAIQAGGTPVGLIAADKTGSTLTMRARAYPEHQESREFDAEGYLHALTNQVRQTLTSPAGED
jgi:hypothetical protein